VVRGFALGVITGSFITAGGVLLAGEAQADTDRLVYAYAAQFGTAVCMTLDDFPSIDGVLGVAAGIVSDGLSTFQAGRVIYLSVQDTCPRHMPLLQRFMASGAELTI
jgi:hypothetical protein